MRTVKVRGLFRLERSEDFNEYLRSAEESSLEALLDNWEAAARRVLRAAGLPDRIGSVILEAGGGWREGAAPTTPADVERFARDLAARGERIVQLDDVIEARDLELTIEYRAAKVLFYVWLLRRALAAGNAREAASNALSLQKHVDAWMATLHWERPVAKYGNLRRGGRTKGPREETLERVAQVARRVRDLAKTRCNTSEIARRIAREMQMKDTSVRSMIYRKKLLR